MSKETNISNIEYALIRHVLCANMCKRRGGAQQRWNIYRTYTDTAEKKVHHVHLAWMSVHLYKRSNINCILTGKLSIENSSTAVLQSGSNIGIHLPDPWWPAHTGLALAQTCMVYYRSIKHLPQQEPVKHSLELRSCRTPITQNSTSPSGVSLANACNNNIGETHRRIAPYKYRDKAFDQPSHPLIRSLWNFARLSRIFLDHPLFFVLVWCSSSPDVTNLTIPHQTANKRPTSRLFKVQFTTSFARPASSHVWRTKINSFGGWFVKLANKANIHRNSWLCDIVVWTKDLFKGN